MAFKKSGSMDEQVRKFVAEVLAERGVREDEHIDRIEAEMEALGDAVAREFATALLVRHGERTQGAVAAGGCPQCGGSLRPAGKRARKILTTRGAVGIEEAQAYCPACRRHFFPSDGAAGVGSQL